MEKFLEFWSHYNPAIIETLVALILFFAIYLAYRAFFTAEGAELKESARGEVSSSAQIEKTLQKILEQQTVRQSSPDSLAGSEVPLEMLQELGFLKKSLEEKEKQIVVLQSKASQAEKALQEGASGPSAEQIAAAASAAAGLAEKERLDYESKIKELEARLAEYEIISEDIADLSFFKEENARLTKELEEVRKGGGSPAPSAVPSSSSSPLPPLAAVPDLAAAETKTQASETLANEILTETASSIDDSLMAEFAKAVEDQKSSAATKEEDNKLVAEIANFNKKS
ncbi:MAG: hypothetical protein ACXVB4_08530 [Pseudobdellovibrionaceae bacterium]